MSNTSREVEAVHSNPRCSNRQDSNSSTTGKIDREQSPRLTHTLAVEKDSIQKRSALPEKLSVIGVNTLATTAPCATQNRCYLLLVRIQAWKAMAPPLSWTPHSWTQSNSGEENAWFTTICIRKKDTKFKL